MRWLHPSARALRQWLDDNSTDDNSTDAVDRHVVTCARCADRLDALASPLPPLGAALTASLRTPDDLVQRLGVRMTESMRTREDLQILLELLGIPLGTVRNLLTEEDR